MRDCKDRAAESTECPIASINITRLAQRRSWVDNDYSVMFATGFVHGINGVQDTIDQRHDGFSTTARRGRIRNSPPPLAFIS
jgi:hypothetical protein